MPRKKIKKSDDTNKVEPSGIHLNGEEEGYVEVYETCDEVGRKIAAHLRHPKHLPSGFPARGVENISAA